MTEPDTPPPNAASLIAAHIRRQIAVGELAEGDALPSEAEMIKRLGVSRPTLRQAFRILETEHLIAVHRGSRGGGTVLRPTTKLASRYLSDLLRFRATTLGDVLAAQLMIEPAAAALIARRRDDETIERLRDLVSEQQNQPGDDIRAKQAHKFHIQLVELAGNPVLAQYCTLIQYLIRSQIPTQRSSSRKDDDDLVHESTRAHADLVELIAAGAPHAASEHWRRHLGEVHAELAKELDLDAPLEPPT